MGVTGLWKLIESSGKPVPLETLENKILAIDISIWLHQVIKGFQDAKGGTLPNAHLLGLFHRLCKLLFYKIKPIFVFDGGLPVLKRQTMAKRTESKNKLLNEADRLQSLLLTTLAKEKVVQQALGGTAVDILAKSPVKPLTKADEEKDDMFKLPPMKEEEAIAGPSHAIERKTSTLTLHSVDVDSTNFKTLPADIRHEILTDLKETRKQNSWGRLHELPAHSDQFSTFQMQRLLKRRKVQVCLEDTEKEMGGQTLSVRDLERLLSEEGIIAAETNATRIHADDNTRFLMVSSIKVAMEKAIQEEVEPKKESEGLGPEFNDDLKKAVQKSLNEGDSDEAEGSEDIFMSQRQKSSLTEAAKEMARAYMMEYAGMSNEDVIAILGGNADEDGEWNDGGQRDINETLMELVEKNILDKAIAESLMERKGEKEVEEGAVKVDSDSDSDLEEVRDEPVLEIIIDPSKVKVGEEEDDLFADIFEKEGIVSEANEDKQLKQDKEDTVEIMDSDTSSEEEEEKDGKELSDQALEEKTKPFDNLIISSDSESEGKESIQVNSSNLTIEEKRDSPCPSQEVFQAEEEKVLGELSSTREPNNNSSKPPSSSPKQPSTKDVPPSALDLPTTSKHSFGPIDPKKILEALEKEKEEVLKLTLDNLTEQKEEIIDLLDSPESTPSKKRTLTDYFQTTPRTTPKSTPDKIAEEAGETVPYVKSPFFVKKTPRKSSEKKRAELNALVSSNNKATKFLFNDEDSMSTQSVTKPVSTAEIIQEAADLLKSQKSAAELEVIAGDLKRQNRELEQEKNKQNRFGLSVTQRMGQECQDLLRLFGIPYIVAPMEAEAQCAFLNAAKITDGIITDDSDVWLFGGETVYKNFFDQKKHVLEYKMGSIEQLFHIDRRKLVQLALLVGSDYTTGITGIGAVTGMEILAQFPCTPAVPNETSEYMSMLSGLRKFKDWWSHGRAMQAKGVLRNKLKNISIAEGFPSPAVVEAYMRPRVDDNTEAFTWGTPDAETIREFTKKNFGWTRSRTDELLMPVMKKLEERVMQKSIKNYFNISTPATLTGLKVSKRVERAVRRLDPNAPAVAEVEERKEAKKPATRRKRAKKGAEAAGDDRGNDSDCEIMEQVLRAEGVAEKKAKPETPSKPVKQMRKRKPDPPGVDQPSTSKRAPRIPDTKQVIPQRDRTQQMEEEKKKKAAEIFKNKGKK